MLSQEEIASTKRNAHIFNFYNKLNQYSQQKQWKFCNGTVFCYLLHPSFCNMIGLNKTPLKSFVPSSQLYIMKNFAELKLLPMMEFSFNTSRQFPIASLLKYVSDFATDVFFVRKGDFSWTYLLGKTPRRAKILIFSVWNKILKIWNTFWANTEVQCSKNYCKTFLPQEAGAFRNNTE